MRVISALRGLSEGRRSLFSTGRRTGFGAQSASEDLIVGLPVVPSHCDRSFHMFYLQMPSLECRQAMIAHLRSRDILSVFHYLPLHLSEMGRTFGGKPGDCPLTELVSDGLLRLPFYNDLDESVQERVIAAILELTMTQSSVWCSKIC